MDRFGLKEKTGYKNGVESRAQEHGNTRECTAFQCLNFYENRIVFRNVIEMLSKSEVIEIIEKSFLPVHHERIPLLPAHPSRI